VTSISHAEPPRAALYARSAAEAQGAPRAVDRQLDALRAYCRTNGLAVVAEYADPALSGLSPMARRPAGRQVLADAEAGRFDVLVVDDASRLARSAPDLVATVMALDRCGVNVRAANGGALAALVEYERASASAEDGR